MNTNVYTVEKTPCLNCLWNCLPLNLPTKTVSASGATNLFFYTNSWLLAQALCLAWRDGVRRVHVHTCTLDHPAALSAYRRAGFIAYRRAVERFPDPRLIGILPLDCAPQLPLVGTLTAAPSPAS